ncbi:hypothetical protein ACFL6S_14285 [Candidatus Poribacteria bacterium]
MSVRYKGNWTERLLQVTNHMKPRTFSGDGKLRNLRLLHGECQRELHVDFTREEMAEYSISGIDYLRLLKRKRSPE